jgi:hypothetical protein
MNTPPLRQIDFTTALGELQSMIGEPVLVMMSLNERFFGSSFHSELERVDTLPPDDSAVVLHFANGASLDLDPAELRSWIGGPACGAPRWLELRVGSGPVLTLEVFGDQPSATA